MSYYVQPCLSGFPNLRPPLVLRTVTMAATGRIPAMFAGVVLTVILLADKALARSKRSPYYKAMPDFWGWYKYFTETNNQEAVEDLDRLYLTYMQNKHRNEEGAFGAYMTHLSEVYKSCANSDDPDCIAEATSKPKAKLVMPLPLRDAKLLVCNPYIDPYCLFPGAPKAAAEAEEEAEEAPAPAHVPAPFFHPLLPLPYKAPVPLPLPLKTPAGIFYYAPPVEPFLSKEQKAELLKICNPADVECLQYHLRSAYGYNPIAPVPSYSALGCDPAKDPYCWPRLVHKAPSGFFHLYPVCDPETDPFCAMPASPPAALTDAAKPAGEQACHPLFDKGCNPLTATKLASPNKPVMEFMPQDEPAEEPIVCNRRLDPGCILAAAAALKRPPPPPAPRFQTRHRLGVRGKTKDGHECFMHYDKDCTPLTAADKEAKPEEAKPKEDCHPFDPSCGKFAQPSTGAKAISGKAKNGIIEPDPDCDPEMDYNCRLRRAEEPNDAPAAAPAEEEPHADAPAAAPEHPQFEDFMRPYMGHQKK
ncbi:actinodin2 [Engraulis encrasicolus]|uniref:actinodin2 n=1 Tax=Engraulis encrasicolus TaxID=184585 RepID=UPI002FD7954E